MKITSIELKTDINGIKAFREYDLKDIVLLTGANGSGKTRLLKLIERRIDEWNNNINNTDILICIKDCSAPLTIKNADSKQDIYTVNYSHFDAKLQTPGQFTPYVISKARKLLQTCNYEETALNSLLLLQDMAKKYSPEYKDGAAFKEFQEFANRIFHLNIGIDENSSPMIFKRPLEQASLSPGQQYLLRMAVTCFMNRSIDSSQPLLFLFDEPELHLHPEALLSLMDKLKETFPESQFWISTHSLALIAHWSSHDATTLIMNDEGVSPFRSNSSSLLEGLLGSERNRFELSKLLVAPSEYAINRFALECLLSPEVKGSIKREYTDGTHLNENDKSLYPDRQIRLVGKLTGNILDFGAGQGRFLEEYYYLMQFNNMEIHDFNYYAYDVSDAYSDQCKANMRKCSIDENHYHNGEEGFSSLLDTMEENFDYVILANVLHEIEPNYWEDVFSKIYKCLKKDGFLYIVEKTELSDGEAPYDNGGFLVLSESSAQKLFEDKFIVKYEKPKSNIVCFIVEKNALCKVDRTKIIECLTAIKKESTIIIENIHEQNNVFENEDKEFKTYKNGIKLAFWVHQLANAVITLESISK